MEGFEIGKTGITCNGSRDLGIVSYQIGRRTGWQIALSFSGETGNPGMILPSDYETVHFKNGTPIGHHVEISLGDEDDARLIPNEHLTLRESFISLAHALLARLQPPETEMVIERYGDGEVRIWGKDIANRNISDEELRAIIITCLTPVQAPA